VQAGWFLPLEAIELLPRKEERSFCREHLAPLLRNPTLAATLPSNDTAIVNISIDSAHNDDPAKVDSDVGDIGISLENPPEAATETASSTHETSDTEVAEVHHAFSLKEFFSKIIG
jgi:hypothetical protein